MNISDTTLRVFYEVSERAGWEAFWKEQAAAALKGLTSVSPDDVRNIHNLQNTYRLFQDQFPRIQEKIDQYVAQRATTAQSTVPKENVDTLR